MGPSFLVAVFVVDLLQESESENRERGAYDNASGISISQSVPKNASPVCLRGFGPEGVCQSRTRTPTRLSFCPVGVCVCVFVSFLLFRPPFPFPALLCPSLPSAASVLSLSSPSQIVRAPLLHVGTAGEGAVPGRARPLQAMPVHTSRTPTPVDCASLNLAVVLLPL